jgi:hypothetical protein
MPQQTPYTPNVDPLESLLRRYPLSDRQRAGLWDLYETAVNPDDLAARLESMELDQNIKAKLWELKSQETAPVPKEAAQPEGSAMGRFMSNLGETINPVTIAEGLYNTVRHPIETGKAIIGQQADQFGKAKQAESEGRYSEMVGHSLAAAIPILGPAAAAAGEQIGSGDVAGGLGKATGLVGTTVAGGAVARRGQKNPAILQKEAEQIVADRVLAPANPKYKRAAQEVAPEVLKRGMTGDRNALVQQARSLIDDAAMRIDEVIDSYPPDQGLPTKPVIDRLDAVIKDNTFTGVGGAEINPLLMDTAVKLREMRDFVHRRGPTMTFADMRRLRQQLDSVAKEAGVFAKTKGDPSISATGKAASETANSVRRQIASERPELSAPNADMHLGITLEEILDPLKGRPKTQVAQTGVTGGLSTAGAIIGQGMSNIPGMQALGAMIMSDLLPRLRNAQLSPENQLRLAQDKYRLAEALRAGKVRPAQRIIQEIRAYVPALTTGPATQRQPQ